MGPWMREEIPISCLEQAKAHPIPSLLELLVVDMVPEVVDWKTGARVVAAKRHTEGPWHFHESRDWNSSFLHFVTAPVCTEKQVHSHTGLNVEAGWNQQVKGVSPRQASKRNSTMVGSIDVYVSKSSSSSSTSSSRRRSSSRSSSSRSSSSSSSSSSRGTSSSTSTSCSSCCIEMKDLGDP